MAKKNQVSSTMKGVKMDLYQLLGVDEEYDDYATDYLFNLLIEYNFDINKVIQYISNEFGKMSPTDAFIAGMGVQQFIIYTRLLKYPNFVVDRAKKYVGMLKRLEE